MTDNIRVRDFWGSKLITAEKDDAEMEHHWWVDVTDGDRWVLCAEIIHADDTTRHYVPTAEMHLPAIVEQELSEQHGVETLHHINDF